MKDQQKEKIVITPEIDKIMEANQKLFLDFTHETVEIAFSYSRSIMKIQKGLKFFPEDGDITNEEKIANIISKLIMQNINTFSNDISEIYTKYGENMKKMAETFKEPEETK